jgi:hypothetical protein
VKARVEVHGGVRGREGEPLSSMKLYKEVESAVVVGVCYNSGSSNPQIDLHIVWAENEVIYWLHMIHDVWKYRPESCNVLTEVEVWSRGQIMIDIMPVQNFREGDIHFDIKILPSFIHKRFQRLIVMEGHKTATALLPMSHHMR